MLTLLPNQLDMVSPNAKPRWRDDDAGANEGVTYGEIQRFILPVAELLVEKAQDNAQHIADLVPKINDMDTNFREKVIELVSKATTLPDEQRETVRTAVREFLNWENSFNQDGDKHDRYPADVLRPFFDTLAADDLVVRHSWIFSNGWVELPDGHEEDHEKVRKIRNAFRTFALREIFQTLGWSGIHRLAKRCGDPQLVGWELIKEPFEREDMAEWLCQWYLDASQNASLYDSLTSGVLHALPQTELLDFLNMCLPQLEQKSASYEKMTGFMVNAPQGMNLWQFIENKYQTLLEHFWLNVQLSYFQSNKEHLLFCIEKLLAAGRPRTAINAMGDRSSDLPGESLIQILKGIAFGQEENAELPRSWHISRVFKTLADTRYSPSEMISLEFIYYPMLKRDKYGAPHLMAEILGKPEFFMELINLAYRPHNTTREPLPEHLQTAARTASSLLHEEHGVPGMDHNGEINIKLFFSWINRVRELAKDNDREVVTDLTIGAWLSDWPLNKNVECWPHPIIAELLDQDDCKDIRRGFKTGVYNTRGVTTRMPYDGGTQERKVSKKFRHLANYWKNTKPNVAIMIEALAKSYEYEAKMHDEEGLWNQES